MIDAIKAKYFIVSTKLCRDDSTGAAKKEKRKRKGEQGATKSKFMIPESC
jgi:hypothetical protein